MEWKHNIPSNAGNVFFRNYTKLGMLAFWYCLIMKSKINSAKSLPPVHPAGSSVNYTFFKGFYMYNGGL